MSTKFRTLANWQKSGILSPIGEFPPYSRQYIIRVSTLANFQLAKVILAKFGNPVGLLNIKKVIAQNLPQLFH